MENESDYIKKLNRLFEIIATQLNWPDYRIWQHGDFVELSERILNKTQINISASTLKRFAGKTSNTSEPSRSVKKALALFAGYDSWTAYVEKNFENPAKAQAPGPTNVFSRARSAALNKKILYSIVLAAGVAGLWFLVLKYYPSQKIELPQHSIPNLGCSNMMQTIPASYDLTFDLHDYIGSKLSIVNFGSDGNMIGNKKISQENITTGKLSFLTTNPDYYRFYLLADGNRIDSLEFCAYTAGWVAVVKEKNDGYPNYITDEALKNGKHLTIPTEELINKKINPSSINAKLYNVNEIFHAVDGDNFSVNIRFRNSDKPINDGSRRSKVGMMFKNGFIEFYFVMPGFKSTSNVFYSEVREKGNTHDLKNFEIDLDRWQEMRCEVRNKQLKLSLNGNVIYRGRYRQSLGFMNGFGFKGFLEIEYIELFDKEEKLVYSECFNTELAKAGCK